MGKPEAFSPLAEQELERLRAKSIPRKDVIELELRHVGGEIRKVQVLSAEEGGSLEVRWDNGAGVYAVHVFRAIDDRGAGHLFRTSRSRVPLHWQVTDVEAARDLWRKMTGRRDVLTREEWFKRRMRERGRKI